MPPEADIPCTYPDFDALLDNRNIHHIMSVSEISSFQVGEILEIDKIPYSTF